MNFLFIFGSILLFGNTITPDIQSNTMSGSFEYYELKDEITIEKQHQTVARFAPSGASGIGLTLYTHHRVWKSWRHLLTLRHYQSRDFSLDLYTTGIDYVEQLPGLPITYALGAEIGKGEFKIKALENYGVFKETLGKEVHLDVSHYFILFENLGHVFIRPAYRYHEFIFDGKTGVTNQTINGDGIALSTGIGFRF
ncbi:hypothetical protein WDW89_06760 [Deltaproteobacteria bacterium TL4]